ncbi:hypothetical protein EDD92_0278 [Streptomyces sp. TLI_185]|nr:hypothetical protein EDD92_0278 [Streptomyces sp. TLI_185]
MVTEPRHIPGKAGNQVDRLRVGLEVDEELGLLRRAHACEVPQPLVDQVLLALDTGDPVPQAEQHLVDRLSQLCHSHALAPGRRQPCRAPAQPPGRDRVPCDRGHRLKPDQVVAEVPVADQVDRATVLAYGMRVVAGEVADHADQPGCAPQDLGRGRHPEPVSDQVPERVLMVPQPGHVIEALVDHTCVGAAPVLHITDRRSPDTGSELRRFIEHMSVTLTRRRSVSLIRPDTRRPRQPGGPWRRIVWAWSWTC